MAKISGITVEIGADAKGLKTALKDINSSLKNTKSALKDVDKLLKLDPTNTELLKQKQKLLKKAVEETSEKLEILKNRQDEMDASGVDKNSEEYQKLRREIIETEAALKAVQKEANKFHPALEKIKASAKKAADGLKDAAEKTRAMSAAAAGALTSLAALGYKAVTNADDLNTFAKQTGFTTEEIQKMQYAADRIDVSFEDITGALKKFKGKIDPANKSLEKLGVSVTDSDGNLRDAKDVFFDTVRALSEIQNETEKDQLAMELFGKSADSLAGIIDDGGKALEEYGTEAENLGLIMDQETLDSLNSVNDEIDKLKAQGMATFLQLGAKAIQVLTPLITTVAEAISKVLDYIANMNPETLKIVMIILAAVAALSPLLSLLSSVATAIAFLASPIGIAIVVIGALVAAGVLLYKNWDKIKETASKVADAIKTSWDNIKTAVSGVIETVTTKIDDFKKKFDELKEKVEGVWETIKGVFTGEVSLPHIPLPHFSVSPPGWSFGDLLKGSIPSLSIDWYKKAYDNPMVFTRPTVLPTSGGLKGFGDGNGAEIVMGLDKLREMMGSQNGVVINVYASEGMDVNALADKIQQRFVRMSNQRRAAHV